jgi:hypothetical protein
MRDVAPHWAHPTLGRSVRQLLAGLPPAPPPPQPNPAPDQPPHSPPNRSRRCTGRPCPAPPNLDFAPAA